MSYTRGDGFYRDIVQSQTLLHQLKQAFPVYCNLGHTELFESENVLIRLHHWPSREYLQVRVFKPLPHEVIPEFLWALTQDASSWGGDYFLPEERRQRPSPEGVPF